MRRFKKLFGLFLPVLMLLTLLTGTVQAALLDFGPIVPEVEGSTPPNIGHGFPAWFRDTNRVPLQMCLDEVGGCLFAAADRPNPALPASFPANLPDELFYYSATATMTTSGGDALLFAGVEMNFFNNGPGNYDQVGFSRVRIRFDTTITGNYTVTTPWKQYHFIVTAADLVATPDGRRIVNATEDIGLRADGDFAGVITGNIGPYGYSQGAPFVTATGAYLGDGTPRILQGTPNNIFRIEGPPGFTTVSTNLFAVTGKLYTDPIATPLTVDKLTYALDNTGMQVNVFATTDPLANPRNTTALFPLNFALSGVPSALQLTGTGTTFNLTTNNPADGKFFLASGLFAAPGILPDTVTLTNTGDNPDTAKIVPLVDDVVISKADYNPLTNILSIAAVSYDNVNNPALQAFIAGTDVLLGNLANGQLNVGPFPVTIGPVTYNIPPQNVTVKSAKLGSATLPVSVVIPGAAPVANNDTATTPAGTTAIINVLTNDTSATSTLNPASITVSAATGGFAAANPDGTITYIAPATPGTYTFTYTVKDNSATPVTSNVATVTVTVTVALPVAPTLVSPNGTVVTATPVFTWNAVPNASSYTLWNGNSGFTTYTAAEAGCPAGTGTCSATLATPLPVGTTFFWGVRATNVSGSSLFSAFMPVTFGIPPVAPTLVGPNGTVATATPTYTWNAVSNATSYTLWNENSGFTTYTTAAAGCPAGTGTCSATLTTPLPAGTTFNWGVKASSSAGSSPYSYMQVRF